MAVLILCHGNICRSPMAATLMAAKGFTDTVTAGMKEDGAGKRVPKKVRDWLLANQNLSADEHRSRVVTPEMLAEAELILYMDGGQKKRLTAMWLKEGMLEKRGELDHFAEPLARYLKEPGEKIGDPMFYKATDAQFLQIMAQLVEASENFVEQRNAAPIIAAAE